MRYLVSQRPFLALAAIIVLLLPAAAMAGKPGSKPTTVEGVAPYVASKLFASAETLAAARLAISPDLTEAWMLRDLEVDSDGGLYALFAAVDATDQVDLYTTPPSATVSIPRVQHMGIVRWDGAGPQIAYETRLEYDAEDGAAYDEDFYRGRGVVAFDLVPEQTASSGVLESGDVVALHWIDDDPSTAAVGDDAFEVTRLTPAFGADGAFVGLSVQETLARIPAVRATGGIVAADPFGRVYVSVPDASEQGYSVRRFAFDAATQAYTSTDMQPAGIDVQWWIEVDGDGHLYMLGQTNTADAGAVFRWSPDSGTWSTFAQYGGTFRAWGYDNGAFLMDLREPRRGGQYVALVQQDATVSPDDRVADTYSRSVRALTADEEGHFYVLHQDYVYVDGSYEAVGEAVYQLEVDTSSTGGSGGGKGGGKGKK